MATCGFRLLSALVNDNDYAEYVNLRLSPQLFREAEQELFGFIQSHVMKYAKMPALETLESYGFGDDIVSTSEPPAYYLEEVKRRLLRDRLKKITIGLSDLLQNEEDDKAYSFLAEQFSGLVLEQNQTKMFDFRNSFDLVEKAFKTAMKGMDATGNMNFHWPRLDHMTSGLSAGDVLSIVGRPSAGKTFLLLYLAWKSWLTGRTPLFVSLEMNAVVIMQRLTALQTKTKLTNLMKGEVSTSKFAKIKKEFQGLVGKYNNPLWVIDGNMAATVDDIVLIAKQLGATEVYIDAAYLLRHPDKRLNKWDRMSENAEMIKKNLAEGCKLPVAASYQLSKSSKKEQKAKGQKADWGMEDIYGSDAIAQLSTVILGLLEKEGIETQLSRKVKILKGRNGETGEFQINWEFNFMDFTQILEAEDLKYMQDNDEMVNLEVETELKWV